ncbi:MAG: FHA domain-containing protein [Phototrophicaceae bacterium]
MQIDVFLDAQEYGMMGAPTLFVMVNFHPKPPATTHHQRRPLNISLVIDKSGSMSGQKIDYTRQAALLVLQNLTSNDMLSVVTFNEGVETILPPSPVKDKNQLAEKIRSIHAGGTTNLSGGWLEGINYAQQHIASDHITRVILLSDGHANRGITDSATLVSIARQKFNEGVVTTAMGLGDDFNEDLLIALADAAGGAFYFIESPEVTPTILKEELTDLLNLSAQNLTVTLEPTDLVQQVQQLTKYPMQPVPRPHTTYRLGDLYAEEERSITFEVKLRHQPEPSTHPLLHLTIEFDEVGENQVTHHKITQLVSATFHNQPTHTHPNETVWRNVLILRSAEARRKAIELSDIGKLAEASRILREAADQIAQSPFQDSSLAEEQVSLRMQSDNLGRNIYDRYDRKTMSTQAYFSERSRQVHAQSLRSRESQRQQFGQLHGDTDRIGETIPKPPTLPEEQSLNAETHPVVTHLIWGDQTFNMKGDLMRIGRAPQNEIVIDVAGISRFHCQLKRIGMVWMIEDLASTNGTYAHGKMIEAPYRLQHGDEIYICNQCLRFEFKG